MTPAQPINTNTPPPEMAPPDINSSAPDMDLSALRQPAQPTVEGTTEYRGYSGAIDAMNAAAKKQAALVNEPAPPPPPHQRLMNMIAGLGAGLSGFGTAIATHGERGGAEEVQNIMGARQQQQIEERQAALAQKNAAVQQQITIGETNRQLAQSYLNLMTVPDEITAAHVKVQTEQAGLAGEQQRQAITGADFQATHGGMAPTEFSSALSGTAPAAGQTGKSSFFTTNAQQQLDAATKVLGADDPYVQKLQTALAPDSKATSGELWLATNQLQTQLGLQEKATTAAGQKADLQSKQQAADPLFKFQSDPKVLADPGAQATLQAYIDNPANKGNLNGIAQAQSLIAKAGIAQQHAIALETQKATATKNAEQAATAGNPNDVGQMLFNGGLTLADLKSRGSTPKQITEASQAAERIAKANGQVYNPSDEIVGEHALQGTGNQTFYGSARSLVQQGGMLDILKTAHDNLGNQKVPALNTYLDWLKFQAGTPELAAYRAAVLGASDDYAKVIGGGSPSDSARQTTADQFIYQLNNTQFDGAVNNARSSVRSQVEGRIGSNRYIQQREGDILKDQTAPKASDFAPRPANAPAGSKLMHAPGSQPRWMTPDQIAAAQKAGVGAVEVQ